VISIHDFNSQWWGGPVGIVRDPSFFSLSRAENERLLEPYDWVEFKSHRGDLVVESAAARCGFQFVDLQIVYKAGLNKSSLTSREIPLELVSAEGVPFDLHPEQLTEFTAERFSILPGVTPERVCQRYVAWASLISQKHPKLCFEVRQNNVPQGWVCAEPTDSPSGLNFTLVMTSKASQVRGIDIYTAALRQFAQMGYVFCHAAFSAFNVPAHNIHAMLGARFLDPIICWIWVNPRNAVATAID
jgi:hypothetical protein